MRSSGWRSAVTLMLGKRPVYAFLENFQSWKFTGKFNKYVRVNSTSAVYSIEAQEKLHSFTKRKAYYEAYFKSISDPSSFWSAEAKKYLTFSREPMETMMGDLQTGDIRWFAGGKLNASYNCLDRHLDARKDQVALIWEADEPSESRSLTYNELFFQVSKIANVMKANGVKRGDIVTIYMAMTPDLVASMLACARIGAIHCIVFGGFSSEALKDRINDCGSKWVLTTRESRRGGKRLDLKATVDRAIADISGVKNVFVFERPGLAGSAPDVFEKDINMTEQLVKAAPYSTYEDMDSEDTLFILYTSGSTGKPKALVHSTAGYLLTTALTIKTTFDLQEGDIFCSTADCGWITGHSFVTYGPLLSGSTSVLVESTPTYPNPYRYWNMVEKHKITQFYTAPTSIRQLMKYDPVPISRFDLSSLRIIGTCGEPINPEAWKWYFTHVGRSKCVLVDTYWQTETGSIVLGNFPGVEVLKPGSLGSNPSFGIELAVIDPTSGEEYSETLAEGVLAIKRSWPSISRSIFGNHQKYLDTYMRAYPGYYITGDVCKRDKSGYYWITGRVDDVINTSGHRLGTAELESALVACEEVAEAACIGHPHTVKGEAIGCFVTLKQNIQVSSELSEKLKLAIREAIGPIATPDFIVYAELPKTRSGKIMRRILKKIVASETKDSLGDVTTLADPTIVDSLVEKYREVKTQSNQ